MASRATGLASILNSEGKVKGSAFDIGLNELVDVGITTNPPVKNQILRWDDGNSIWKPGEGPDIDVNNFVLKTTLSTEIESLTGTPPETLDSLSEIATAMSNNVSALNAIQNKMDSNKQFVLLGDGTSKIFDVDSHKAGFISTSISGVEQINRIRKTNDTSGSFTLTIDDYDFYSGTGSLAYKTTEEFLVDSIYNFVISENGSIAPNGFTWGAKKDVIAKKLPIGEILTIGSDKDYIWTAGTTIVNNSGIDQYSPISYIGGRNNNDLITWTPVTESKYYYKLTSFTAPNPEDAGTICDKIYFKNAPASGAKIFVRIYS